MAMSSWLVLAGICLIYVALGFWAVSQIFPCDRAATPGSDLDQRQEAPKT
jgi:hypothetical protein